MRLDINLASHPYEDARQFWLRWGSAAGALGIVTLVLVTLTITGWLNARRDHAAMAEKRAMIADRERIRTNAEDFLNRPENRNTRDTSQFLNQLIESKSFSWTHVLEDLEKVMPPRVHVVGINPELDEDNQLALKMTVAGDSRDRAIELARRMEESRRFAQTNIVTERFLLNKGANSTDTEQIDLMAEYIPLPAAKAANATTPPPDKTANPEKPADAKGTAPSPATNNQTKPSKPNTNRPNTNQPAAQAKPVGAPGSKP
jgi:type IV pilus assembly protein PilN